MRVLVMASQSTRHLYVKYVPDQVRRIQNLVKGYIVGGSVRDMIMNKEPKDYDITTQMTPDQIKQVLEHNGYKVIPTGEKYGTITTTAGQYTVDITTFRSEKYDYQSRKPEVSFVTDIKGDLARRDFTINAMAMDDNGDIIDPYGGENDIKEKKIDFVGNPGERIAEDPLRMIRACRFSSKLGFSLGKKTEEAIKINADELSRVSKERITDELRKSSDNFSGMFQCLTDTGLLKKIFPLVDTNRMKEVKHDYRGRHHGESVYEHTVEVIDCLDRKRKDDLPLKLAGMFHDVGKVETEQKHGETVNFYNHENVSEDICKKSVSNLKGLTAEESKETCWLVGQHIRYPNLTDRSIPRNAIDWKLHGIKSEEIRDLTDLVECDLNRNEEELYDKTMKAYNTPRPESSRFMNLPPEKRGEAIRSAWIEEAGKSIMK